MPFSSDIQMEEPGRRTMGSLYRDLIEALRAAGTFESVRAAASPATARMLEHPPWALGWIEAAEFDETLETLRRLHGKEAVIAAGLDVARRQSGTLLKPLVRTLVALAGSNPGTIYANLDGLYNVTVRGIRFEWQPEGEHQGTMLLRASRPPPPEAVFWFIEGTLHYGTDLCGVQGTFERKAGPPDATCAWSIRWKPRAA